jgi:hypothetical protein
MQISEQLFDALKDTLVDLFYGYKFNLCTLANTISNLYPNLIDRAYVNELARQDMIAKKDLVIDDAILFCYQELKQLFDITSHLEAKHTVSIIRQYYYLFDFYMSILAEMEYNGELPGV